MSLTLLLPSVFLESKFLVVPEAEGVEGQKKRGSWIDKGCAAGPWMRSFGYDVGAEKTSHSWPRPGWCPHCSSVHAGFLRVLGSSHGSGWERPRPPATATETKWTGKQWSPSFVVHLCEMYVYFTFILLFNIRRILGLHVEIWCSVTKNMPRERHRSLCEWVSGFTGSVTLGFT